MTLIKFIFFIVCISFFNISQAQSLKSRPHLPPEPLLSCFKSASRHYNVDFFLLSSIGWVESKYNPKAVNYNKKNGSIVSVDYNVMQINSFWSKELQRHKIHFNLVQTDPCLNIHIGAWVLAQSIQRYGLSWKAIGSYNVGIVNDRNYSIALNYTKKVYQAHEIITQDYLTIASQ